MRFKRNEVILEVRDHRGHKRPHLGEVKIWLEHDLQIRTPKCVIVLDSEVDPGVFTTVEAYKLDFCCYSWNTPVWFYKEDENFKCFNCNKSTNVNKLKRETLLYSQLAGGVITGIIDENSVKSISDWFTLDDGLEGYVEAYMFLREFEQFIGFIHPRLNLQATD